MTKEQAIKLLEHPIYKWSMDWDEREDGLNYTEAIEIAIAALRPVSREQVEKVWRGEWKPTESPYMNECEDCSVCGYRTPWGHGFRFCPACGAAQTDEAVEMVMERMNKLHD